MPPKKDSRGFNLADSLREVVKIEPWLVVAVMNEMTATQWERVITGETFVRLQDDLTKMSGKSLSLYPNLAQSLAWDVAGDAFVKLLEGKFLKLFDNRSGRPRAYLRKAGKNLSRVLVRSLWRQYLRDRGLPPMKSRKAVPLPPDAATDREAA